MTSSLRIFVLVCVVLSGGWPGGLAAACLPIHDGALPQESSVLDSEEGGLVQRGAERLHPPRRTRKLFSGLMGGLGAHPAWPTALLSGSRISSFDLSPHRDLQRFRAVRRI